LYLYEQPTAVDGEDLAGDEVGGGEIEDGLGDFVARAGAV
jgi:hypothetical protein